MHFYFKLLVPPLHVNCKPGIFIYEGNHEQPFCLINISGYEFLIFMN